MFEKISKRFIHPTIQINELTFAMAKTFLLLLLFFLLVLVSYACLFIFNGVFYNLKAFINYLGVLSAVIALIMLRTSPNLQYPLRLLGYLSIVLITCGVYLSGGFASNDILWYLPASLSSLLFIGKTDGIIMTCYSLLAISTFYIIDVMNWIELPMDPLTRSIHYRYSNAIAIFLILFFLIWILVKSNNRFQRIIQDIQKSQVRESISQDFHDELGNKLASVVHLSKRLKGAKNEQEKLEMLGIIERESQIVYDNFRDFIWTNGSNSLTISSLFMYLTDFNQQFFAHKETQVEGELIAKNEAENEIISTEIVRHIVPLFKEFMTNIYKHAHANRVDWSLTYNAGKMILKIQDDGIGFNSQQVPTGRGLKGIQKRILQLNAAYEMNTSPSKGTSVSIQIDLTT